VAWSPDGKSIAFSRDAHIWVTNPDGTAKQRLGFGDSPTWSPNSQQPAFTSSAPERYGGIFVMNADGTQRRKVAGAGQFEGASWGPPR
jgi:Tol biopolymer transport system component